MTSTIDLLYEVGKCSGLLDALTPDSRLQGVGRDRSPVLEHRGQNPHPLACQGYAGVPSWDFCFEAGQILREDRPSTLAGVADAGVAGADGSSPTDLRDRDSIAWLRERSRCVAETGTRGHGDTC